MQPPYGSGVCRGVLLLSAFLAWTLLSCGCPAVGPHPTSALARAETGSETGTAQVRDGAHGASVGDLKPAAVRADLEAALLNLSRAACGGAAAQEYLLPLLGDNVTVLPPGPAGGAPVVLTSAEAYVDFFASPRSFLPCGVVLSLTRFVLGKGLEVPEPPSAAAGVRGVDGYLAVTQFAYSDAATQAQGKGLALWILAGKASEVGPTNEDAGQLDEVGAKAHTLWNLTVIGWNADLEPAAAGRGGPSKDALVGETPEKVGAEPSFITTGGSAAAQGDASPRKVLLESSVGSKSPFCCLAFRLVSLLVHSWGTITTALFSSSSSSNNDKAPLWGALGQALKYAHNNISTGDLDDATWLLSRGHPYVILNPNQPALEITTQQGREDFLRPFLGLDITFANQAVWELTLKEDDPPVGSASHLRSVTVDAAFSVLDITAQFNGTVVLRGTSLVLWDAVPLGPPPQGPRLADPKAEQYAFRWELWQVQNPPATEGTH